MLEVFGLLSPSPSSANSVTTLSLAPAAPFPFAVPAPFPAPAIGARPFGIARVRDGLGGLGLTCSRVLLRDGGVKITAGGAIIGAGLTADISAVFELRRAATGLLGDIAIPIMPGFTGSGGVCCCHSGGC